MPAEEEEDEEGADLSGVLSQLLLGPGHAADGVLQLVLGLAALVQAGRHFHWRHPGQETDKHPFKIKAVESRALPRL